MKSRELTVSGGVMADADELAEFCQRTYPRLVGALDLYVGDVHLAEELAQEALIRATKRWRHVRDLESPGGWTYRVAVNLANSWYRRRRAEARAYARSADRLDDVSPPDGEVGDRDAVRAALLELPEPQRAAVVCRYYLGMSGRETADALGISHDAARARTTRAIAALRDQLGPTVDVEEGDDAR